MRGEMRFAVAAGVAAALLVQPVAAHAAPAGTAPPIAWGACAADVLAQVPAGDHGTYTCATYQVPLDYAHPSAGTVSLALLRRSADDRAHRVGSLFLNPGGPGGSGYTMPMAGFQRLPEVAARFDLIGFDPRGVGRSTPVRCFTTDEEAEAVFGEIVDVPVTRAEIASTLRGNRDYTRACAANAGPLLGHVSTLDVARDLDRMRAAVGESRINYLGFSYGTLLGATYANLYPQRVRTLVLDGNVDPALRTGNGLEYLRQRAAGQEEVVNAFLALCKQVGSACAFSAGGDPAAKFAEIRTRLRQGPITVPALGGTITLSMFTGAVSGALYSADDYPDLAANLQALYEAIHPAAAPAAIRASGAWWTTSNHGNGLLDTPYSGNDAGISVNCADEPFPRTPEIYPAIAARWERESPTVGRGHAFSQLACATWPVTDPERYHGPWNRPTANPVLLFGNYHDPATNYHFDRRMAAELGSDRLVSVDAYGHTILGGQSACADTIATQYLIGIKLPPPGTVCQTDRQPFDQN
ncbi:alpha/beta hydrolase [Actinoplanes subtropicus]|uniref:alpha/beta hydrolase n=1 Tax=Actinoplanes subtropicus TaxID=543632 RepID=UPI0004C2DD53|nr:alpha/beta hydrolase [Actinoplanes subtropicus]